MSIEELILFHSKRIHHIQNSLQTINLFDLYPNLKELINMFLPSKLDFKNLNEVKIGFNYKITLVGCNEITMTV